MAALPFFLRRLLLLLMLVLATAPIGAQAPGDTLAVARTLTAGRAELTAIDRALDGRLDRSERQQLRDRATALAAIANDAVTTLQGQLQLIDARITELGPVSPGMPEAPDIAAQRRLLGQQRSTTDSEMKRGRLLAVDATQLRDEITATETEQFNQKMSARTASPLSPAFWAPVLHAFPRDLRRAELFVSREWTMVRQSVTSWHGWIAAAGLALALIVLGPVQRSLRRIGRRYVIERAPESRMRRSAYALWVTVTGTLAPGLAVILLIQSLRWANMLTPGWDLIASTLVHVTFVAAAITALGGALLQRRHPAWRMIPIGDGAAGALRRWTWIAAGVTAASLLFMRFNDAAGISGPAAAAGDAFVALAYALLISGILLTIGELRAARMRSADGADAASEPVQRTGVTFATLLGWLAVAASLASLSIGFLSLSRFIAFMTVWITIVGGALYLLLDTVDVVSTALFARDSRIGRSAHYGLGIRQSAIDQFGVLVSALLRVLLVMVALGTVLMPFGTDVGSLFGSVWALAQGVTIGQVTISPGAILRAAIVLALGMFLVGLVQSWLTARYLPTTELDASARNSISMIARYTGIVLAGLWALASLGIGLERIGLLLSALSVGIGFGLQAITQNFVSGLILLAERPVKIGDWVKIGDQEGDVKRISVRATEIQVADRSTLIVPNSELITKTIQNMTLADPIGRIQLQFSVTLATDALRVREIVLAAFKAAPGILPTPEPAVLIDQISEGRITFNCFAYVPGPRDAYSVRSAILFDLLATFAAEKIDVGMNTRPVELVNAGDLVAAAAAPAQQLSDHNQG